MGPKRDRILEKLLPPVAPFGPAKSGPLPSVLLTSPVPDALPEDPALTLYTKHAHKETDMN